MSTSFIPIFFAFCAHCSAARCAAKGVLLRLPLKPIVPPESQQSVEPLLSAIVMIVLLKVALMCTIPLMTFLRIFFFAIIFYTRAFFARAFFARPPGGLPQLLDTLLRRDDLLRPLPCARIGPGVLPANG